MAVVGDEGPGACSIAVGEDGFQGVDLRSVKEGLGGFGEREGGMLYVALRVGRVGRWAKRVMPSTPSFAAPSRGIHSFGFPGRPSE